MTETTPSTGSEDFGFFGQTEPAVPLAYYKLGVTDRERLGTVESGNGSIAMLHEAGFYPDSEKKLTNGDDDACGGGFGVVGGFKMTFPLKAFLLAVEKTPTMAKRA